MGEAIPAPAALMGMATGFVISKAVATIAELGIADALETGPKTAGELAALSGADARPLYRVLRTLAGFGLFAEAPETGHFSLTPLGEPLRRNHPASVRDYVLMANDTLFEAFSAFSHSVRTGERAFDHVFGRPVFAHLAANPEKAAVFQGAMNAAYGRECDLVAETYDFSDHRLVLDVGGGNGQLLSAILTRHPHLEGILFDLEPGIANARAGQGGPLPRCQLVAGDFFEAVPQGADLLLLKHVIHDWDNERSVKLLDRCRHALAPGGRIVVLDAVVPPGDGFSPAKVIDLIMLAVPGGVERTEAEFAALFQRAGLQLETVRTLTPELSILAAH
jgi:SAM-dependent methyltransferase